MKSRIIIFLGFVLSGFTIPVVSQPPDTICYQNIDLSDSVCYLKNQRDVIYFQLIYNEISDTNRLQNVYQSLIPTLGMGYEQNMTKFHADEHMPHYCNCDVKVDSIHSIISWNEHVSSVVLNDKVYTTLVGYSILCKRDLLLIRAHNIRLYEPNLAGTQKYPRIYDVPKIPLEEILRSAEDGILFDLLFAVEKSVKNRLLDYSRYMVMKEDP